MKEMKIAWSTLGGKIEGKRPLEKPDDNIKIDL
jgi:hypothetical protein